ncbi:hypothetical protein T484DRAFT_3499128 [Baffinella frigidus]|nr:hypothetical protein T484DRAFT_3499128 [Cryptophyta sp. CCMP2293]
MMQKGGGGGGGMHEALVLEGYQHHALMRIGQPSNVAPDKCRPRCGANPEPLGAREDQQLLQARASAVRTYRWLQGLPSNVERLSMSGMQLEVDDAILVEDFLRRRGRNLVELDLKSNRLDCKALLHILAGLRHTPKLAGLALGENPLWQGAASSQLGKLLGDTLEQHCPKLERLGLGGTGLQDDDVKFLAAAIKSHSSLKQLGLSGGNPQPSTLNPEPQTPNTNTLNTKH